MKIYYGVVIAIFLAMCALATYLMSVPEITPTLENRVLYARQLNLTAPTSAAVYVDPADDTVLVIRGTWKQARYDAMIERINRDFSLLCKMGFDEYDIVSLCLINAKGEEFCSSQDQEIELLCPKVK